MRKFLITILVVGCLISKLSFAALFKTILLTGGAGYIGSHVALELLDAGYHVVIVDDFSNSHKAVIRQIGELSGKKENLEFFDFSVQEEGRLDSVFAQQPIDAVIHLAGYKAVGESFKVPLSYYNNNLNSTLKLLEVMKKWHCPNLVFSSSATVYGMPQSLPIDEKHPLDAINPYGQTKLWIEYILNAEAASPGSEARFISLRYFNPIGAHISGDLGEHPQGTPNNLLPVILEAVMGKRAELTVFGDSYDTKDGTGVRDYIHVVDLAKGHLAAIRKLENDDVFKGHQFYNLGTGKQYTVLDVVNAVEEVSHRKVPYKIGPARKGDAPIVYADPTLAEVELKWKAQFDLKRMVEDSWRWVSRHPDGYAEY